MVAEFGNRDLEVGQEFEQEGLEFLVGAVDLVDQQNRRGLAPDGRQQRPLEQIVLGEDPRLDLGRALARALARLDGDDLALIVPLIERRAGVEPLVALHADELGAVHERQRLRDLGLADPGLALDQERTLEGVHHPERRREVAVGDIADFGEARGDRSRAGWRLAAIGVRTIRPRPACGERAG